ncbi:P-loop containing nucleoside triphosphate hydrolase protein [Rhodocollybia butyracea]|uniref:P-loop containing nucleoside triphosphate hydrolase protein n=1 Tax=Rhodocollybia butyracea TaxID=206335 RepID=A0A9P5Q170_9AGAR|nr:P-loop containing nucleoside triphosphate hydrolase protein [Rhodocollybia butyracea]
MPPWFRNVLRGGIKVGHLSTEAARSVTLRPYQEHCLQACEDALRAGNSRIGCSMPTGSGKTTVFISLLSRIPAPASNLQASRSLIIVNSIELARQSAEQVARLFPSWTVQIEQGAKYQASGTADVTVATYQTLLQPERFAKFDPARIKAVIIDEAHHAAAPSYLRLLSHFDPNIRNPDPEFKPPSLPHTIPIIGFSATLSRHDGIALGSVFERIVYHRDFLSMIKEQWLCGVRFTTVQANIDLEDVTVSSSTGDFNATSLAHVINTDSINHLVVQTWLDRAADRRSTLVFCVNIAHVRALTQVFRGFGIDARYLYSKTPTAERKALIASFKAGKFPVLVNCAILTEGADIPNIDCVVVARPTRSRNVFAQMIGRGMRLSPDTGKTDCRIIDFVNSANRVSGVVFYPTLFGLDPADLEIEDETPESLEEKSFEKIASETSDGDDVPDPESVIYTDYEDPFAFVSKFSGVPTHVNKLSNNAWVGCGNDIYVLECLGKGFIRIEKVEATDETPAHFVAYYTSAPLDKVTATNLKASPFQGLLRPEWAIKGCDTYAKTKVVFGPMALGLLRSARWRKDPATPGQLKFVSKRWNKTLDNEDGQPATLTKGEAANIITRLRNGAKARHEKKVKQAVAKAKATEKERARRAREEVRVGPLSC